MLPRKLYLSRKCRPHFESRLSRTSTILHLSPFISPSGWHVSYSAHSLLPHLAGSYIIFAPWTAFLDSTLVVMGALLTSTARTPLSCRKHSCISWLLILTTLYLRPGSRLRQVFFKRHFLHSGISPLNMNSRPSLASRDPMSVILVSLSVIIILPFKFFSGLFWVFRIYLSYPKILSRTESCEIRL